MIKTPTLLIKLEGRARLNRWGQTDFQLPPNELEWALSAGRSGEAGGSAQDGLRESRAKRAQERKRQWPWMHETFFPSQQTARHSCTEEEQVRKRTSGSPMALGECRHCDGTATLGEHWCTRRALSCACCCTRRAKELWSHRPAVSCHPISDSSHRVTPACFVLRLQPFIFTLYIFKNWLYNFPPWHRQTCPQVVPHSLTFLLHSVHGFEWKEAINLPGHQRPRSLSSQSYISVHFVETQVWKRQWSGSQCTHRLGSSHSPIINSPIPDQIQSH